MANLKTSKAKINVGVDVGKFYLDIWLYEKDIHFQVENNATGIKQLLERLSYYQVERIVMEATGRHEYALAEACYDKGLPVVIVKPISIRRYAGAIEALAKTDRIDAFVIAFYAATIQPKPFAQKSKKFRFIKDLMIRRRQLIQMRTQELNRINVMGNAFEVN